eukprot:502804_1
MSSKIEACLGRTSQSPTLFGGMLIISFSVAIVNMVLSAMQSQTDVIWSGATSTTCPQDNAFQYVYPFSFYVRAIDTQFGCPWRERNTIFRLVIVCLSIVICVAAFICLCWKEYHRAWFGFYTLFWLLFVMMFIVFIVDCDGLHTGHQTCLQDFNGVGGAPSGLIDSCSLTPFIWVPIVDIVQSLCFYCIYKIAKYKFDINTSPSKAEFEAKTSSKKDKKKKKKKKETDNAYDSDDNDV